MSEKNVRIDYSKTFLKKIKKAPLEITIAFKQRFALFLQDPKSPQLHDHALTGKYLGCRSINVTGDWRAIYSEYAGEDGNRIIVLRFIGTHSELYG